MQRTIAVRVLDCVAYQQRVGKAVIIIFCSFDEILPDFVHGENIHELVAQDIQFDERRILLRPLDKLIVGNILLFTVQWGTFDIQDFFATRKILGIALGLFVIITAIS